MNTRRKILVLLCALTVAFSWGYSAGEAVAAEPIKIGAFFDLSGTASFIGTPTKLVATMVVEKINKEGGINGRPLELVIGDTEGDQSAAETAGIDFVHAAYGFGDLDHPEAFSDFATLCEHLLERTGGA